MKRGERNPKFFQEATNKSKGPAKSFLRSARETGQVNLSNRNLRECPRDLFFLDENLEADEKYWEINPMTKIDLSHNAIPVLPDEVDRLFEFLHTLKLRDNALTVLPDSLYQCTALRHLDIAMNSLREISGLISNLQQLRELFLGTNNLVNVPESLCRCNALQTLELQENRLRTLPPSFFFTSLLRLNLSSNDLQVLPDSISDMVSLNYLEIKKNHLIRLPSLAKLVRLTFLDASENKIEVFPLLPAGPSALDRLFLGCNKLRDISVASLLPSAQSLSELHVHDNSISEIPSDVGLLSACKLLDFSNNNIADLPASVGWMNQLQRFGIEGNPIRTIRRTLLTQSTMDLKAYLKTRGPPAGGGSTGAAAGGGGGVVVVGDNGMGAAVDPVALAAASGQRGVRSFDPDDRFNIEDAFDQRIRDLTSGNLDFSKMALRDLPHVLLHKLQTSHAFDTESMTLSGVLHLNLSSNSLVVIPVGVLRELKSLRSLDISSNKLGEGVPVEVGTAIRLFPSSLKVLDVSKNRLSSEQLSVLIADVSLTVLIAANNQLKSIPREVSAMNKLQELRMSHNQIRSLDSLRVDSLPCLEIVDVNDNQVTSLEPLARTIHPRLSSLSVENNSIVDVPLKLGLFPALKHLSLYGNPQKTIRTHVLGNTDAILKVLVNRMSPEEVAAASETRAAPPPVVSLGGGGGGGGGRDEGISRGRFEDDYRLEEDRSGQGRGGRGGAAAPSRQAVPQAVSGRVSRNRPMWDEEESQPVPVPQHPRQPYQAGHPPPVLVQPRGTHSRFALEDASAYSRDEGYEDQRYSGQTSYVHHHPSSGSVRRGSDRDVTMYPPPQPTYAPPDQGFAPAVGSRYYQTEQQQSHPTGTAAPTTRYQQAPPGTRYESLGPRASSGVVAPAASAEVDRVQREIVALEDELEQLSISVSRKAQIKRQLALNRANLLRLKQLS